jgi:hypothetical protein
MFGDAPVIACGIKPILDRFLPFATVHFDISQFPLPLFFLLPFRFNFFLLPSSDLGMAGSIASCNRFSALSLGYKAESALANRKKTGPRSCSIWAQRCLFFTLFFLPPRRIENGG